MKNTLIFILMLSVIAGFAQDDLYTRIITKRLDLYLSEARKETSSRPELSETYYRKIISTEGNYPQIEHAYKELSGIYLEKSRYRDAMDLKNEYLERFPDGTLFQRYSTESSQDTGPSQQGRSGVSAPPRFDSNIPQQYQEVEPQPVQPQPEPERKSSWVRFRNKVKGLFRKAQNVSETALGVVVNASIQATTSLSDNEQYRNRVKLIAEKVVAHSPRQDVKWRFYVIKDKDLNAFAVPGGYIYINEGTVRETEGDDSALAGVIAHEIGHVTSRHSIHALERSLLFQKILDLSDNKTIDKNKQALLISYVFLQELPISRENEYEADKWGVTLSHRAGYDPEGLVRFFDLLRKKYGEGSKGMGVMFSTHPATDKRITHARGIISGLR